ncbi:hypothetical protein WLU64_13425, partial [Bordetella bronchiseptica]
MAKPDQLELLFDVAPPADPASAAPPGAPPRKTQHHPPHPRAPPPTLRAASRLVQHGRSTEML